MGEGAGVLVMESLEHAQKRGANILCEYLGGALTCDAYHMTDPRADGLGVSTCIELAIANAKLDKDAVRSNARCTAVFLGVVFMFVFTSGFCLLSCFSNVQIFTVLFLKVFCFSCFGNSFDAVLGDDLLKSLGKSS